MTVQFIRPSVLPFIPPAVSGSAQVAALPPTVCAPLTAGGASEMAGLGSLPPIARAVPASSAATHAATAAVQGAALGAATLLSAGCDVGQGVSITIGVVGVLLFGLVSGGGLVALLTTGPDMINLWRTGPEKIARLAAKGRWDLVEWALNKSGGSQDQIATLQERLLAFVRETPRAIPALGFPYCLTDKGSVATSVEMLGQLLKGPFTESDMNLALSYILHDAQKRSPAYRTGIRDAIAAHEGASPGYVSMQNLRVARELACS